MEKFFLRRFTTLVFFKLVFISLHSRVFEPLHHRVLNGPFSKQYWCQISSLPTKSLDYFPISIKTKKQPHDPTNSIQKPIKKLKSNKITSCVHNCCKYCVPYFFITTSPHVHLFFPYLYVHNCNIHPSLITLHTFFVSFVYVLKQEVKLYIFQWKCNIVIN